MTGVVFVSVANFLHRRAARPVLVGHVDVGAVMPFQSFPKEFQCSLTIQHLGDEGFKDFPLKVNGTPEAVRYAVDLHKHFVQMPTSMVQDAHPVDPRSSDLGGDEWAKPVLPKPDRRTADFDAALVQQVLDVPEREWVAHLQHHRQTDDLGGQSRSGGKG